MTGDDITRILACPPWGARVPHVGASKGRCAECGCRVAIAKSSARVIALGARILCNGCAGALMDREGITDIRRAWVPDEIT